MNDKLKKVIFDYVLKDMQKVEIIYYRNSIWFIDRKNRYWYFEYHKTDKHLWWRWSHFTQGLKIFSIDTEKEQYIFGELVNMILKKKQKLESKYPNKVFNTIGSVINFEDKDEEKVVVKNEIKTTDGYGWKPKPIVDEVLNNEVETIQRMPVTNQMFVEKVLNCDVETISATIMVPLSEIEELLNNEVKTTPTEFEITTNEVDNVLNNEVKGISSSGRSFTLKVDEALNCEVETTSEGHWPNQYTVDEALNCDVKTICDGAIRNTQRVDEVLNYEVETIQSAMGSADVDISEILDFSSETTVAPNALPKRVVEKVLNYEVETTNPTDYTVEGVIEEVLNYDIKTIEQDWYKSPQLIDDILYPKTTEGGELIDEDKLISDVLEIKNIFYGRGSEVYEIERALNSVSSAENGADHIMDFILTEGTERPQEEQKDSEILTQSPKLIEKQYDIDLVLDNTIKSIDGDLFSHDAIVDGILKKF
jgi:hypothetical protein